MTYCCMDAQDKGKQRINLSWWSRELGVHRTTLWRWLKRDVNPSLEHLPLYERFLREVGGKDQESLEGASCRSEASM